MLRNHLILLAIFAGLSGCGFHPAYESPKIGATGICDMQKDACAPHPLSPESDKELTVIMGSSEYGTRLQISWYFCGAEDKCRLIKEQVAYTYSPGTYSFHLRLPWAGHFREGKYRVVIASPVETRALQYTVSRDRGETAS